MRFKIIGLMTRHGRELYDLAYTARRVPSDAEDMILKLVQVLLGRKSSIC